MTIKRITNLACFNLGFHWFSTGLIIPVLTLLLIEKGLTLVQIGFAFAVYSGTIVILEIPTGGLSDIIGRKKVYQISLIFQLISSLFLIISNSIYGTMICFIFNGISRSLSSGTMDAYFIDEFYRIDPKVNLQKQMSIIGVYIPIALGIGSLLGGYIPIILGSLTEASILNSVYASNLIILAFATLAQLIFTSILINEKIFIERNNTISSAFKKIPKVILTSINYGLKNNIVLILLITGFAWGFSISGLEQLWQPQVKRILNDDTKTWVFGLLTCGYFIASGLGNFLITPICKMFKNNYVLILFYSRIIMGALYLFLAFQNKIKEFSFLYITLFMFNGFQESPESAIFNEQILKDKRSTMLSFLSLFIHLGGILGAIINGLLAHSYSIKISWIISSLIFIFSAVLYLLIPNNRNIRKTREF